MKLLDEIKRHEKELKETISNKSEEIQSFGGSITNDLNNNTVSNIPQEFGEFLDVVMGDKVTTQRSSVLNNYFFSDSDSGKHIVEYAKERGKTITQYLEDKIKSDANSYYNSNQYLNYPIYITAGRGFGISYIVGKSARKQSKFADKDSIFYYLSKEHIDCVRNKRKKDCVKDFYNYKKSLLSALEPIKDDVTIPINKEVDTISLYSSTFNNKEQRYDTYRSIIGDDNSVVLNSCEITTTTPLTWDKISRFSKKRNGIDNMSLFSITFIVENKDTERVESVGTFQLNIKESYDESNNKQSHYIINDTYTKLLKEIDGSETRMHYGRFANEKTWACGSRHITSNDIIKDMKSIIDLPEVKSEIDKRINLYKEYSEKLLALKHKYADLYFIESDF